jgi:hypothetical protein
MLQLWLMPQLQKAKEDFIFQQAGALPHFQFDSTKKNGIGWPVHFAWHSQPLCWNSLYHS